MATISLCMIVKNEGDVLARCLESVRDLVEEIIIVDTGSTDHTKEIAAQFTEHVEDFLWQDDFAKARNHAFSLATMDYQMWLDADDVLRQEDRELFRLLKQTLKPPVDVVMMPYHVAFDEQGNPTMTYYRERLLRREAGFQWKSPIHEVITPSGTIVHWPAAVCHKKEKSGDPDRNLRIFEGMLAQGEQLDARQQYYYARELFYHQRHGEAIDELRSFLHRTDSWIENQISACLDLSKCLAAAGREEEVLVALFRSFEFDEPRAEICCAIGGIFSQRGQYERSIYWYEAACRAPRKEQNGGFATPDCHDFIPYLQLCVCYDRIGDSKTAKSYHDKAALLKPEDRAVRYNQAYFEKLEQRKENEKTQ